MSSPGTVESPPGNWNSVIQGHKVYLDQRQRELYWRNALLSSFREVEPAFQVDDRNRRVILELYRWAWAQLGGEPGEVLDASKGILLYGPIGTGKTTLLRGLQRYFGLINRLSFGSMRRDVGFEMRSASEMSLYYTRDGMDALARWMERGRCGHLCIDEMGREGEDAKFFGSSCNVVRTVLQMRYELRREVYTLGSTNLDMEAPEEFCRLYGEYVLDRTKEMFNMVRLDGPSRRI